MYFQQNIFPFPLLHESMNGFVLLEFVHQQVLINIHSYLLVILMGSTVSQDNGLYIRLHLTLKEITFLHISMW